MREEKEDGWIQHDGNPVCPIAPQLYVAVRFRDGFVDADNTAVYWCPQQGESDQRNYWSHQEGERGEDIVAYRVLS